MIQKAQSELKRTNQEGKAEELKFHSNVTPYHTPGSSGSSITTTTANNSTESATFSLPAISSQVENDKISFKSNQEISEPMNPSISGKSHSLMQEILFSLLRLDFILLASGGTMFKSGVYIQRNYKLLSLGPFLLAFFYALDRELEKLNGFFNYKASEMERRIHIYEEEYRQLLGGAGPGIGNLVHGPSLVEDENDGVLIHAIEETLDHVERMVRWTDVNQTGLRKILKK